MLMRTISADGTTNCSISLRTNGGILLKTDKEDCGCVYYQSRLRSRTGHFEFVRDQNGSGFGELMIRWCRSVCGLR